MPNNLELNWDFLMCNRTYADSENQEKPSKMYLPGVLQAKK